MVGLETGFLINLSQCLATGQYDGIAFASEFVSHEIHKLFRTVGRSRMKGSPVEELESKPITDDQIAAVYGGKLPPSDPRTRPMETGFVSELLAWIADNPAWADDGITHDGEYHHTDRTG